MYRFSYAVVLLLIWGAAGAADIYRWLDDEGHVVYSDTPQAGAEKIKLGETTILPATPTRSLNRRQSDKLKAVEYRSLSITSPADEQSIRDNGVVNISVAVSVQPALQIRFGHKLRLLFDGQTIGDAGRKTSFSLNAVERGAHTLKAEIVGSDGRVIDQSPVSRFFLHKQSVNRPH